MSRSAGGTCANPQVGDCAASQGASQIDPGSAKTRAFNLLVESSSQFGQSENQTCRRRLSEVGNRENGSTLSWLAHVFTRSGPKAVVRHQRSRLGSGDDHFHGNLENLIRIGVCSAVIGLIGAQKAHTVNAVWPLILPLARYGEAAVA